jgi:hypothetical protein
VVVVVEVVVVSLMTVLGRNNRYQQRKSCAQRGNNIQLHRSDVIFCDLLVAGPPVFI